MAGFSSSCFFPVSWQDIASSWAEKCNMRVAARMHAVFCRSTRSVMRVDLVLEPREGSVMHRVRRADALPPPPHHHRHHHHHHHHHHNGSRQHHPAASCYLASVYACSGGVRKKERMRYAARYMQGVQAVCNRDMNFFPRVMVMRVSHGGAERGGGNVGAGVQNAADVVSCRDRSSVAAARTRVHARDVSMQ